MELVLLSSSRTPAGYFTEYLAEIKAFSAGTSHAAFVPFAAVALPWPEYAKRVSEATGLELHIVENANDVASCDLVVVGGGNTFQLLGECRRRRLLAPIRQRVRSRKAKYLGWSAGANLACPTIKTTNDMPIVDPGRLDALSLIEFQINPHYVNVALPGHHGETRDERLAEFTRVNPSLAVLALPEGDWLRVSKASIELRGAHPARWFAGEKAPLSIGPNSFYQAGTWRGAALPPGTAPPSKLWMRRHHRTLFRTARAILRDDAEAEDALVLPPGGARDFSAHALRRRHRIDRVRAANRAAEHLAQRSETPWTPCAFAPVVKIHGFKATDAVRRHDVALRC